MTVREELSRIVMLHEQAAELLRREAEPLLRKAEHHMAVAARLREEAAQIEGVGQ